MVSERLPPVHARRDQPRREHVGRDAVRHRDPQRRVVVGRPVAPRDRHRREVVVVERTRLDRASDRSARRGRRSELGDIAALTGDRSQENSLKESPDLLASCEGQASQPAGARLGPRLMKRPAPFLPTNLSPSMITWPCEMTNARRALDHGALVRVVVDAHVERLHAERLLASSGRRRRCRRRCRRRWCPCAGTGRTSSPASSSTARRSG